MHKYGLIGYKLEHSFSKDFFEKKFSDESILNAEYNLYPLQNIEELPNLLKSNPELKGLNVTIPYKESVIPYLNELHDTAKSVGAVNTIKINEGYTIGYNTDTWGFAKSLFPEINTRDARALILGTGGASKAVQFVFNKLGIDYKIVSRGNNVSDLHYEDLNQEIMESHNIIIQCTPVGMYPNVNDCLQIPFQFISTKHFCLDLVYNPTETQFLLKAKNAGASVKNGLQMLYEQAEESWKIWNS